MKFLWAAFLTLALCACIHESVYAMRDVIHVLPQVPVQRVTEKQYEESQKELIKRELNEGPFIIGGKNASLGQFPYQVAVHIDGGYFCGGSVISENYVVTAAHCGILGNSFHIYLGTLSSRNDTVKEPRKMVIVSTNPKLHEQYNAITLNNDICILRLSQPVQFNQYVRPINLPRRSQSHLTFENKSVFACGWGKTSDNARGISTSLMYTQLTTISNQECANYYRGLITISQICAKGSNRQNTCQGDSGGPLVMCEGGSPLLIGITSFVSKSGCEKGIPSAYARVTTFLDWIQNNSDVTIQP